MTDSSNLDLVRSIFEAWERGDFSSAEWAHPEIELVIVGGPAPVTFSGLAEMAAGFRTFAGAWEGYSVEADEFRELDGERVIVLIHDGGRGKSSGLELGPIGRERALVFQMGGARVRRLDVYWDRDRALAELGLEG
jgi:ketosteroid isomerase-like protein